MFDNPTDNHTDIEVPLYYELRFTKLKSVMDRQTDRRTENTIHRATWSQLKMKFQGKLELCSGKHFIYRRTNGRTDGRLSEQGKSEGFDSCDRPSNLKLD